MAREYAKNWVTMWTDEDFCQQPVFDKLFYQVLLGQPPTLLNYAGTQPLSFKRWRKAMREDDRLPSELDMKAAMIRMERRAYVFTDDDTCELLIRSFIRRDEVTKQPHVLLSALRAAAIVESPKLAFVLLDELANRVELPEISGTSEKAVKLRKTLKATYAATIGRLETLSQGVSEPFAEPFAEDFPEGLPEPFARPGEMEPFAKGFPKGLAMGSVGVEVEVESSPSVGGYVGEGRESESGQTEPAESSDEPPSLKSGDPEPPLRCPKHAHIPADAFIAEACPPCGKFREAHGRWVKREQRRQAESVSEAAHHRAELKAIAIAACRLCDPDGYRGVQVCDHNPSKSVTQSRGMELVRATLAKNAEEAANG